MLEICESISLRYCQKYFDVNNYATFHWMTCGFKRIAILQFKINYLNGARQHLNGDSHIQNAHLGRYIVEYKVGNHIYSYA